MDVTPTVRIYLLTFRRPALLKRAVTSLLNQSFKDWICELHNDDPADTQPDELVREIGDTRIKLFTHKENLGAVASFNFCWRPIQEKYMSILEDDNWWEPHFLEEMVYFMNSNDDVKISWANMRMWQELPNEQWRKAGTVWPEEPASWMIFRRWMPRQLIEPLHSQGAMMVRVGPETMVQKPLSTPLFMIEAARERRIGLPIALNRKICANFALTLSTARGEDLVQKIGGQVILASDYLYRIGASVEHIRDAWTLPWWSGRYAQRSIFIACVLTGNSRLLFQSLGVVDFMLCISWFAFHPLLTLRSVRYALSNTELQEFLAGPLLGNEDPIKFIGEE